MKSIRIFWVLIVLIVGMVQVVSAQEATPEVDQSASVLLAQSSDSGTLIANGDGTYTLTLIDVDDYLLWFTDRPERHAGYLTLDDYLQVWTQGSDSFQNDSPNAALAVNGSALAVEISNPVYDAATNSLTYTAVLLDDHLTLEDSVSLDVSTLFIDDFWNEVASAIDTATYYTVCSSLANCTPED